MLSVLGNMLDYFIQLAPYVIAGSLHGEALKYTSWTKTVYKALTFNRAFSLLTATVLGILSPLCTYGTVPVVIALIAAGVPPAPMTAFLATSSMMNPQLFIMTVGGLGWEVALWRLLAVFIFGMGIGALAWCLPGRFVLRDDLKPNLTGEEILNRTKEPFCIKKYAVDVGKNLLFVGKMMLIGITLASIVDELPLAAWLGNIDVNSPFAVVTAALAGIPLYACGGGTIPMVSSLMAKGMTLGAAVAFLTAGPATRITSLMAVSAVFKKRFLVLYVIVLLLFCVSLGVLIGV